LTNLWTSSLAYISRSCTLVGVRIGRGRFASGAWATMSKDLWGVVSRVKASGSSQDDLRRVMIMVGESLRVAPGRSAPCGDSGGDDACRLRGDGTGCVGALPGSTAIDIVVDQCTPQRELVIVHRRSEEKVAPFLDP
jgi:hypothetical protein